MKSDRIADNNTSVSDNPNVLHAPSEQKEGGMMTTGPSHMCLMHLMLALKRRSVSDVPVHMVTVAEVRSAFQSESMENN